MKKTLSLALLFAFAFGFAQINYNFNLAVNSNKEQIDGIYKGGQAKFNKDLAGNIVSDLSANGKIQVNFSVDGNKKIKNVKIYPELDNNFNHALERAIARVSNKFTAPVENVAVTLDFFPNDMRGYSRTPQTANSDPNRGAQQPSK